MPFCILFPCMVSNEKSAVILCQSLCGHCAIFSNGLQDFFFAFHFQWFEYYIPLFCFLYLFCLVSSKLLGHFIWYLPLILKILSHFIFKYLFCLMLSILSWDFSHTDITLFDIVPQLLDSFFLVVVAVFYFFSLWFRLVVSFDLSSSSSILSLVVSRFLQAHGGSTSSVLLWGFFFGGGVVVHFVLLLVLAFSFNYFLKCQSLLKSPI